MIPIINASKIYSTLGNSSSLVPLAVKDVANSLGLTAGSYITGDVLEGKDRFLDEFGTQAIWLFGLPVFKKTIDYTLYKAMKIDPKIDVRLLDNPEILDKAIELAPKDIKKNLLKLKENPKFAKNLALSKFGIATALTILSYKMLTKYRHKKTKEAAKREILQERATLAKKYHYTKTSFGQFLENAGENSTGQNPSFTGSGKFATTLKNFMFDPVQNLMIVDGSITAERLTDSRNKQEFLGYTIKEGTTWAFMYFASKPIQRFFEKKAAAKGKPIELDARVIESEELLNALKSKNKDGLTIIEQSIKNFPIQKSDVEIYQYLYDNPDDFIVKMAKKSDELITIKDNWFNKLKKSLGLPHKEFKDVNAIDTRRYIDFGNVENKKGIKGIYAKLQELYAEYNKSGKTPEEFLKGVKKLKRASVLKNIGICIGALGVMAPLMMIAVRYLGGNKDFQVKEDLKKELSIA